jgi:ABC-type uncharacterized transport system auxiliary subunit
MKIVSLLIPLLFISACTPSVNQVDPYKFYTLNYQGSARQNTQPIYDFVKIDLPHVSTKHITENILYSKKSFEQNSYSQSKWKEPLAVMLQSWLVQSMENSYLFKGVIRAASRANVPLIIETDIVKFEHIIYQDEVHVALKVVLIQYNQRKILKQKLFNYHIKVAHPSAEESVISFNQSLIQFDKDLSLWLKEK